MTVHDKNGHTLKRSDQVHFTIDGRLYSGVVHAIVNRDHEPAVLTVVQLMIPACDVTKYAPSTHPTKAEPPKKGTH